MGQNAPIWPRDRSIRRPKRLKLSEINAGDTGVLFSRGCVLLCGSFCLSTFYLFSFDTMFLGGIQIWTYIHDIFP
jgi:hypothetical protein